MKAGDSSRLKRRRQPMRELVLKALRNQGLLRGYWSRPAYQQNDYLAWINRAKRPETKGRRLGQMLEDLTRGDRYMGMPYHARKHLR